MGVWVGLDPDRLLALPLFEFGHRRVERVGLTGPGRPRDEDRPGRVVDHDPRPPAEPLFMLFIKYISDKYGESDDFAPPVKIPKGASFKDMIALKGNSNIGGLINTQVIQPLIDANTRLARTDFPDFNDPNKLGEDQAIVDRLTNLVGIFQKPELDFSKNRAENDDILGDAYE